MYTFVLCGRFSYKVFIIARLSTFSTYIKHNAIFQKHVKRKLKGRFYFNYNNFSQTTFQQKHINALYADVEVWELKLPTLILSFNLAGKEEFVYVGILPLLYFKCVQK